MTMEKGLGKDVSDAAKMMDAVVDAHEDRSSTTATSLTASKLAATNNNHNNSISRMMSPLSS